MSKVKIMRKILLTSIKRVKNFLLAVTLMIIINLIAIGHSELIAAILIGYMLAAFYIVSTAIRLSNVAALSRDQAKRQMLFGLTFRLVMVFVVLIVAMKISQRVFFTMAIGFMTFYLIAQVGLIITSYKMPFLNDDDDDKK